MDDTTTPRVYGSEPHEPAGPQPGCTYVELIGGPLDGQLLDVTGWSSEELAGGALLMSPASAFGPGGRSDYEPRPADPGRWDWLGDAPW